MLGDRRNALSISHVSRMLLHWALILTTASLLNNLLVICNFLCHLLVGHLVHLFVTILLSVVIRLKTKIATIGCASVSIIG